MTYRDEALRRLISVGIDEVSAEELVELMINECYFATHVFNDFARNGRWNEELKLVDKHDIN